MRSEILDSPRRWPQRLGVALALLTVPLMLVALPLAPPKFVTAIKYQDRVLWLAISTAAVALAACLIRTPFFPRRWSLPPLIVLATALLLTANIAWNRSFTRYVATHQYAREVFRRKARNTVHWPIYGRYDNAWARWNEKARRYGYQTFPWALSSAFVAAAWFWWMYRRPLDRRWDARSLAVLMAFQLALIVLFALCEPWPVRLSLKISGYAEFKKDIPAFHGVMDTLRRYVAEMPHLQWYGQHYPPANLILLTVEKNLDIPGLAKSIVCLCTVLSVLPLVGLARELELGEVATSAAAMCYAATTGVLIFCTINMTSLLLLPGTVCLWMLVRGLKRGGAGSAIALGLAFGCYLMFSFSASILGILMTLTTLIGWWRGAFPTRNVIRTGAIALATLLGFTLLLRGTTHFNLIACFLNAVRGHQTQQGNEGFDDAKRYLLRSSGNVLAYVTSIVPLSILAVIGLGSAKPRAAGALFVALIASMLIAGCSGLFYLETERIWIFFTPFFALAAGYELARRIEFEGRQLIHFALLLVLLISCTQEWFFTHYR